MQIKIKYLDDTQTRISKIEKGDWIDLRAAEDVVMSKDDFKLIPLGVAMELPEGYEAHVVPREAPLNTLGSFKQTPKELLMNHSKETMISGSYQLTLYETQKLRKVSVSVNLELLRKCQRLN